MSEQQSRETETLQTQEQRMDTILQALREVSELTGAVPETTSRVRSKIGPLLPLGVVDVLKNIKNMKKRIEALEAEVIDVAENEVQILGIELAPVYESGDAPTDHEKALQARIEEINRIMAVIPSFKKGGYRRLRDQNHNLIHDLSDDENSTS